MDKSKTSKQEESAMGFKDKQKALDTLKNLDERDVSYQYHVIVGLVSRAKRTLQITKDEEKLAKIKEAIQIFEDWLSNYKQNNRGKENLAYLPIQTVNVFRALAKKYDVLDDGFYLSYRKEKGDYKALRTVKIDNDEITWDIERNRRLKRLIRKIKEDHVQWYETDIGEFRGLPTKEHTQCILLGYSPDPPKLKKIISEIQEKFGSLEDSEETELEVKKAAKRIHDRSDDESCSDEEPMKKQKEEESGLSFKDEEKALKSVKSLEGRDAKYQFNAIQGLIRRAERVISCTKDEQKIKNMTKAIEVFQKWITDYNASGRSKDDFGYLNLNIIQAFKPLADKYGVKNNGFLEVYEQEEGDYKKLRSLKVPHETITWDIERNKELRKIVDGISKNNIKLFELNSGLPTKEHVECIMWAFSYDSSKLKKLLPTLKDKLNSI